MEQKVKFSVLLPTRNGGRYLANCVSSILEEPYEDMELVVSDNANTDETQSVLDTFKKDGRLKVIRSEKPLCVTDNWNLALKAASGDYILMMGDDDCILPGYFRRMEKILDRYNNPDCVTYNAYSYIAPYSVGKSGQSYYKEPFFNYGAGFTSEGILSKDKRLLIVRDMFNFRNRIPLNMQSTLMSRRAMDKVKGGAFQPPFPDHYALNSLLLIAESWVFVPEKMLIIGISPKSFGHFVYSGKQEEGKNYLGIDSNFKGRLPGTELNNCMMTWLSLLKMNYRDELKNVSISRPSYVRHQVYSWYIKYKNRVISLSDLRAYAGHLSALDWFYLLFVFTDRQSWQRLWLILRDRKNSKIQNLWQGARPLEGISNIKEFAVWISSCPAGTGEKV